MGCQKHFTKLQKMKNTQSKIKPIKIGKQPGTTYCFGCKDYTQNFRPEKLKITNKVLREKSQCVISRSNKSIFEDLLREVKILKILTQKWLKEKIID